MFVDYLFIFIPPPRPSRNRGTV